MEKKELAIKDYFKSDLFKGKVLLLTGGTSKMLYKIALDFMELGGNVALISRRKEELDKVAKELMNKTGQIAKGYVLNLKFPDEYEKIVDEVLKDFGSINYLLNGAAGNFLAFAENLSYNAFKTVLEIDTLATFYMSKIVYTKFMKKNGGVIVNISANLHHLGTLMNSHASAAKAGVDAITKTLALEWGPFNVRVNGVCPGSIEGTEGLDRLSKPEKNDKNSEKKSADLMNKLIKTIPLQRLGTRSDVSSACIFLFSDLASYISGQTIEVDGYSKGTLPNFLIGFPNFDKMWLKPKF